MYPYKIFLGLTLYDILLCAGIIVAFLVFGFLADKRGIRVRLQKFSIICGCAAILTGLVSASFFQALYNIPERGGFEFLFKIGEDGKLQIVNTGITFYGGIIGGAAAFLLIYFIAGKKYFAKTENPYYHNENFFSMASSAVSAIAIAHSLGRIGCLTAGCCHGAKTDAWYGIAMHVGGEYQKYVPTQLFEAIFLLILFGLLFLNAYEKRRYNLPLYMSAYGAWRFIIEFLRNDDRGSIGTDLISPSQLIALIMIAGAVGVFFLERWYTDKTENRDSDVNKSITDVEADPKESLNDENN